MPRRDFSIRAAAQRRRRREEVRSRDGFYERCRRYADAAGADAVRFYGLFAPRCRARTRRFTARSLRRKERDAIMVVFRLIAAFCAPSA
jgi:hypothetical protein